MEGRPLVLLLVALLAPPAFAQLSGGTSAANPSVATQRVLPQPLPRPGNLPGLPVDPGASAPLETPPQSAPPEAPPAPPAAGEPPFHVTRIRFEGVTLLPAAELALLARACEQREVTLAEVRVLARAVRDRYRRLGYLFAKVLIPEQKLADGVLRLSVYEGRYGRLEIAGNRRNPGESLARYFGFVSAHQPVLQRQLLRALVVVNELPGLTVRSVLSPGKQLGTTDLKLKVHEDKPVHVILDYNNFGSRLVGRNRAGLGVTANGLLITGDELSVRVIEPFPTKSSPLYQASYQAPVSARGDRVGVQYLQAKTRVGGVFEPLDQRGEVEIAVASYNRPIERTPARKTSLAVSLASKTVRSLVLGNFLISQDDLRVLSLAGTSDRSHRRHRAIHQVSVNQGLGEFLNGRRNGDPLGSRAGAGNTFTRVNLDSTCFEQVGTDGSFLARASGQVSTDPLTVAELFAIGGADTVRGFVQAEYLGDEGFLVSGEYRHALLSRARGRLELAGFMDHGEASLKNPQPGDVSSRRLTGAGGGLRATVQGVGTTRVDVARPISTGRTVEGDQWVLYASHFLVF